MAGIHEEPELDRPIFRVDYLVHLRQHEGKLIRQGGAQRFWQILHRMKIEHAALVDPLEELSCPVAFCAHLFYDSLKLFKGVIKKVVHVAF
jgi:hypothetical protein